MQTIGRHGPLQAGHPSDKQDKPLVGRPLEADDDDVENDSGKFTLN